ncbi:MAG: biotin/lipoyl-binding protein [Thermoleophilia bacterium]|nr:biotin/lipoyl-binding protein [Thermoleophilia bacterium]
MKRAPAIAAAVIAAVLVGALVQGCSDSSDPATDTTAVPQTGAIVADGTVLPVTRAELAFPVGGRVFAVPAAEGDTVTAGQVLVSLDDTAVQAAIAAADADVAAAEAALAQAEAVVEAAQEAVKRAEATKDGMDDDLADWRFDVVNAEIRGARAEVKAAQADVAKATALLGVAQAGADQARSALADRSLTAPFPGTVAHLAVKVGDEVIPTLVVARVADLSAWEIETTDLSESSIAGIEEGTRAELTFDALPGLTASGTVTDVGLFAQPYQGTMVFKVTVAPDETIQGLRWGMTATVKITDPGDDPGD